MCESKQAIFTHSKRKDNDVAGFTTDKELQKAKITAGKLREWLKDFSTPYLYVNLTATRRGINKTFVYRYTKKGDESRATQQVTLGRYPILTLADARAKANELTKLKGAGDVKAQLLKAQGITFFKLVELWATKERAKGLKDFERQFNRVKMYLLPHLKDKDVKNIARVELTTVIDNIQKAERKKGISHDTSKRVFSLLRRILDYAVSKGYTDVNPVRDVRFSDAFMTSTQKHFKAITEPKTLSELLRAVEAYRGSFATRQALLFGIHTFLRSANVRGLKWDYVDFAARAIIFPADAMKMGDAFILPMSRQVERLLKEQAQLRRGDFVFASDVSASRPLSENTLNYAIKRLGFGELTVFHGFRSTASTLLHEQISAHGLGSEIIELCLDHRERNRVKAAYDRSQRLDDRARLMQYWSDYLDEVKGE